MLGMPVPGAPFSLIWKWWRRTSMASACSFRFRVLVGLMGIPSHARLASVTQTVLGSSCALVEIALSEAVDEDDREPFVACWCVHPRLIPDEKIIGIPEPQVHAVTDLGFYLWVCAAKNFLMQFNKPYIIW